jgi:subtilisin family serine protease
MNTPVDHFRCLAIALSVLTGAAANGQDPTIDPIIDDRAIVHVRPDSNLISFINAFEANNPDVTLTDIDSVPGREMYLLDVGLPAGYTQQFLMALALDLEENYLNYLISGEFLYENQAPEGKTGSTWVDGLSVLQYENQYAGALIGLGPAHQTTTGQSVVIAMLDTGIDFTHPQLVGAALPLGWDFIDDDGDPSDVGDGVDNDEDGDIDEMTGHGTFVAGLLNLVAPDTRLLPVRVLNSDGVGDGWLLTRGMYYAIDRGVEVINLSLGSTYNTATVEFAIDEAQALGIAVFAAAGNFDRDEPREFPAMNNGLGVVATDHNDVKADFSNYSDRLFISAPGDTQMTPFDPNLAIVSTIPGGGYAAWRGTSFSTPLVAGVAALIRAQRPNWLPNSGTFAAVEAALANTAFNIYPMNPQFVDDELGAGRLDAAAAVALNPPAPIIGDLNNDGVVDVLDLLILLGEWGLTHTSADLSGDGTVDVVDLLIILAAWS